MMRLARRYFLMGAVAALLAAAAVEGWAQVAFGQSKLVVATAAARHPFTVEMATTAAQRSQGLMNRPALAADRGMLFDFGTIAPVGMWMKNTLIPLDMLFIAADGRIVNIAENTKPLSLETVRSAGPVLAVLEVAGGTAKRLGIRPGDQVIHPMFGNGLPD